MIKRNAKAVIAAMGSALPLVASAFVGDIIGFWGILIAGMALAGYLTWRVPNEE